MDEVRSLPRSIYVRFAGGLGNQLFQLAAAMLLAQAGGGRIVPLLGALQRYRAGRQFEALRAVRCRNVPVDNRRPAGPLSTLIVIARAGRWAPVVGVNDRNVWEKIDQAGRRPYPFAMLDGYFQDGWSLAAIEAVRQGLVLNVPQGPPPVQHECVVHVRGKDFLHDPLHHVVTARYYRNAAQAARTDGFRHFRIVTDDPDYARNEILPALQAIPDVSAEISPPAADLLDDFMRILGAPGRIVGNSTFAWWAAALDSRKARTWSPSRFVSNQDRSFALPWERKLHVA